MALPFLPDDILIIVATLLYEEDRSGQPLLFNLRSFTEVNKQFYRCGIPYLYSTYYNMGDPEIVASRAEWTGKRREIPSLWPFARTMLGSPDLGKHVRRIINPREWEVNDDELVNSLASGRRNSRVSHRDFPALDPQSADGFRYRLMLDKLSKSSSVVQKRLKDDPMKNPAFDPTCEMADLMMILSHTPNLEELGLFGGHLYRGGGGTPNDTIFTYPWPSILAEIPHSFARLRSIQLYNKLWTWADCFGTINYLISLPAIEHLNFGLSTPLVNYIADPNTWIWPPRSSNLRTLEIYLVPKPNEYSVFFALLFASCRELEEVKLTLDILWEETVKSTPPVIDSLGECHGTSITALTLDSRFTNSKLPFPRVDLTAFRQLRHLELGLIPIYGTHCGPDVEDLNQLKKMLPGTLETLVVFRGHENLVNHMKDIMTLVESDWLPNLVWLCVGKAYTGGSGDPDPRYEDVTWLVERDRAYMSDVFDPAGFHWSFDDLTTYWDAITFWQVEAYRRSAGYDDIRKRPHVKSFLNRIITKRWHTLKS